jgi:hypothetical protein
MHVMISIWIDKIVYLNFIFKATKYINNLICFVLLEPWKMTSFFLFRSLSQKHKLCINVAVKVNDCHNNLLRYKGDHHASPCIRSTLQQLPEFLTSTVTWSPSVCFSLGSRNITNRIHKSKKTHSNPLFLLIWLYSN